MPFDLSYQHQKRTKGCTRCKAEKPLGMFYRQASRSADGLHSWCKDCCREYNRQYERRPGVRERRLAWRRANEPYERTSRVEYLYGLTPEQFSALLETQGGGCAICGATEPGGRWGTWHVDHDHDCCPPHAKGGRQKTCGKCVRGVLCQGCNLLLGFARDDAERLARALSYLEKP